MACRHAEQWRLLTGNETGALLAWWLLQAYRQEHPEAALQDVAMLASTVSSKMIKTMAAAEGFQVRREMWRGGGGGVAIGRPPGPHPCDVRQFDETLTGFKWLGNRALELQAQGGRQASPAAPVPIVCDRGTGGGVAQVLRCCLALRKPLAFASAPLSWTRTA